MDSHVQKEGKKWEFDEDVTKNFGEMLECSIPGYGIMREFTTELASRVLCKFANDGSSEYLADFGASRGTACMEFRERFPNLNIWAYEYSDPMRKVLELLPIYTVPKDNSDLRTSVLPNNRFAIGLSILTLMFVPLEYRLDLVSRIYKSIRPGGAFFIVEKTLGDWEQSDIMLTEEYDAYKHRKGYTQEQILRKKLSLEGVLVPITAHSNVELLHAAGFHSVSCYFRALHFIGWVAIK